MNLPSEMKAVVINGYGDAGSLRATRVPTPAAEAGEVLIEVAFAGVGVWDVKERDGSMAGMFPDEAKRFPRVIGGDGAGTVVALGTGVDGIDIGDEVYGYAYGSPKGGFYAQYVAVSAAQVAPLPDGVDLVHAAALAIPSGTALRGLTGALRLQAGESLAIFGATGSVGLPAVQLAKAIGVRVFALASGKDGVDHALTAGADAAIDSRTDDVASALAEFAPEGLDAILATANGEGLEKLTAALKPNGRLAWPNGVQPEPAAPEGRQAAGYNGEVDAEVLARLNSLIAGCTYEIALAEKMPLERAGDAHRLLEKHVSGRPVLVIKD